MFLPKSRTGNLWKLHCSSLLQPSVCLLCCLSGFTSLWRPKLVHCANHVNLSRFQNSNFPNFHTWITVASFTESPASQASPSPQMAMSSNGEPVPTGLSWFVLMPSYLASLPTSSTGQALFSSLKRTHGTNALQWVGGSGRQSLEGLRVHQRVFKTHKSRPTSSHRPLYKCTGPKWPISSLA